MDMNTEMEQMLKQPVYNKITPENIVHIQDFLTEQKNKPYYDIKEVVGKELTVIGTEIRILSNGFDLYTPEFCVYSSPMNGAAITLDGIIPKEKAVAYKMGDVAKSFFYIFNKPIKLKITIEKAMVFFKRYNFEVLDE